MADYALRYYKEYGVQDSIVRLEIYKRYPVPEYAPAPKEIGTVMTSARLVMQGDQDDITAPIVKTSLDLSFVDAPDTEYGRMTGPWEEFYTPDSTEFFIKVMIDGVVEWTGYVTPDSYEEDITAYGIVTITARDNIGHLQDFIFEENGNANGMISVQEIFTKAWQLIESRQSLVIAEDADVIWPECYGYRPYELMLNVEAFEGKNWYEVVESVLDSLGLVLRYVGHNEFRVYPLRSIPLLDKPSFSLVEAQPTLFKASGHRSLQRACKKIVDNSKYELVKAPANKVVQESDFTGDSGTYRCKIEGDTWGKLEHDAPIWPITNQTSQEGWANKSADVSLFFNPYAYDLGYFMSREESEADVKSDKVMFIAANNVTDREISFGKTILCRDISIQMKLGRPIGIGSKNRMEIYRSANLYKFTYGVSCVTDAGRYQWDGSDWELQDNSIKLVKEYDYNQSTLDISFDVKLGLLDQSAALLIFTIYKIEYRLVGYASIVDYGIYARIEHFAYAITDEESNAENFKVEVLHDEQYNNLISRETLFLAPAKAYFSPKVIKNGIYLPESGYPPAKPWNWSGDDVQTELQVLIAQQILLYNSKPNNLINGTLVSEDKVLRLPGIWTYNGKKHVLISGSLDLITGYLEDVKLREYVEWDDIYPETYLLTTEDAQNVLTEDSHVINIGVK